MPELIVVIFDARGPMTRKRPINANACGPTAAYVEPLKAEAGARESARDRVFVSGPGATTLGIDQRSVEGIPQTSGHARKEVGSCSHLRAVAWVAERERGGGAAVHG